VAGKRYYGGHRGSIIYHDKPTANTLHPTMKPINLLAGLVADGSKEGMTIYEPFGGSGSTLLACERLNRKCFAMEIMPHYCDVIIQRWENRTGKKAALLN